MSSSDQHTDDETVEVYFNQDLFGGISVQPAAQRRPQVLEPAKDDLPSILEASAHVPVGDLERWEAAKAAWRAAQAEMLVHVKALNEQATAARQERRAVLDARTEAAAEQRRQRKAEQEQRDIATFGQAEFVEVIKRTYTRGYELRTQGRTYHRDGCRVLLRVDTPSTISTDRKRWDQALRDLLNLDGVRACAFCSKDLKARAAAYEASGMKPQEALALERERPTLEQVQTLGALRAGTSHLQLIA